MQQRVYTIEARYQRLLLIAYGCSFVGIETLALALFIASRTQQHATAIRSLVGAGVCSIIAFVFLVVCASTMVSWIGALRKMNPKPAPDYPAELVRARHLFFSFPQDARTQYPLSCLQAVHEKLMSEGVEVDLVCLSIGAGDRVEAVLRHHGHILSSSGTDNLEFLSNREPVRNLSNLSASISELCGPGWEIEAPWILHGEALLAWLHADDIAAQTPQSASAPSLSRRL